MTREHFAAWSPAQAADYTRERVYSPLPDAEREVLERRRRIEARADGAIAALRGIR